MISPNLLEHEKQRCLKKKVENRIVFVTFVERSFQVAIITPGLGGI